MNKRLRSRVLAAGVASTTLFSASLLKSRSVYAQDKPTATELLDRGARLYDQKQYGDAKKILLDVDPGQLPEEQRTKLADLIKNTDIELAKTQGTNAAFDNAQAAMAADKLADAAAGFQAVIDDASSPATVKEQARIQLSLVKQKQTEKAPQMKELLGQAEALYQQNKLDEAQNALNTVIATGSDLGWQDNARPAALQAKLTERRTALASAANAPAEPAPAPAPAAPTPDATAPAAPGAAVAAALPPSEPVAAAPVTPAAPPVPAPDNSALNQQLSIEQIERDRAYTLYNLAMKASKDALVSNPPQYPVAVQRAQEAGAVIDDNRRLFSETEANALRATASTQEQLATSQRNAWEIQQQGIAINNAKEADAAKVRLRETERARRVNQLMKDAENFYKVQQYNEAADILRTILVTDPQNSSAKLMLAIVDQRIADRVYYGLLNRQNKEIMRQGVVDKEEVIPYTDLMVYPEDWVNLTRTRTAATANKDSPANRAARERLEENLKEISADQTGFEKVINFLRDNTGANISVKWNALQSAGIDRNTPVSITLQNVSFKKALNELLDNVGGGTASLGYVVDDGVITISTKDDLNSVKYTTVVVYDIRDMFVQPDDTFTPPALGLGQIQSGSGGGSLFQDTGGGAGATGNRAATDIVTQIEDAIKSTVAPDTWKDAGGTIGSIRELNRQLIINQTVDNHVQIQDLLDRLRETRSLQIAIEARFLLIQNDFLDQFGLSWGLTIPAGVVGGNVGAIGISNNTATLAAPVLTQVPGSIAATNSVPSMSVSGTILDNWQLSVLLQATQADKRTVNLTAPRVTLFNGQRGYIGVTQQLNYISNSNSTTTPGSLGVAPTINTTIQTSQLNYGVTLDITAAASADRRYVVMNIHPDLVTLDGIDTFGALPNANGNGGSILPGLFIQLPRVSKTEVYTMVSVPDGGTLLIGGQKLVGESEVEAGVPILSKIPGLSRLFTNRSQVKDERTLLILVRPKIIIQKEIETALYGPGYDKPTGLPPAQDQGGAQSTGSNGIEPGFSRGGGSINGGGR